MYHCRDVLEWNIKQFGRDLRDCLYEFKQKLTDIDETTYPQFQRVNVVIDRRATEDNKNKIIMFQPPDDCNTIPNAEIPPEYYFDLSRRCLIPRSGILYE